MPTPLPKAVPKGVSNRHVKAKGIKMGKPVAITYREAMIVVKYEGILADKRIGSTERESYIELKECKRIGSNNEIVSLEGTKRFVDTFIEECGVAEPRAEVVVAPQHSATASGLSATAAGLPSFPGGMASAGMGMPMMQGMMPMGMSMMPMGFAPMGMGMQPMGMMMPNGFAPGMHTMGGMLPMAMHPMMYPSAQAGLTPTIACAGAPASGSTAAATVDVASVIDALDLQQFVRITYSHPSRGKTTYAGLLVEKWPGASHEAFIELDDCKRLSRRGTVKEQCGRKRLMTAFVDKAEISEPVLETARSRSRSRGKTKDKP